MYILYTHTAEISFKNYSLTLIQQKQKTEKEDKSNNDVGSPTKGKRGRPKKQQTDIKAAFNKSGSLSDV